jgi:hypothetical protein
MSNWVALYGLTTGSKSAPSRLAEKRSTALEGQTKFRSRNKQRQLDAETKQTKEDLQIAGISALTN